MGNTILVSDDDESIRALLEHSLEKAGFNVISTGDNNKALAILKENDIDLLIQDIKMPERDGVTQIRLVREIRKDIPIIIVTAYSDWSSAVETCKQGVFAYVRKPFDIDKDIIETAKRAIQQGSSRPGELSNIFEKIGVIPSQSPQMRKIIDMVTRVAESNSPCLITGESGVGKELIARALHYLSKRSSGQFVAINCAAIPATLLESELFGYKHGAFTDASSDKKGLVEVADNGTMFLDEIGELPIQLQAKLLRLLENSEYIQLGSTVTKKANIRFVAATNTDLREAIKKGTFREDLYYRVNVISIHIPPLRERKEDIPMLAEYFLKKYRAKMKKDIVGFTKDAHAALLNHQWFGNVRELENVIQSAVALSSDRMISARDLSISDTRAASAVCGVAEAPMAVDIKEGFNLEKHVENIEKEHIRAALAKSEGNLTAAAKLLGMSLSSFRYKAKKHGLIQ